LEVYYMGAFQPRKALVVTLAALALLLVSPGLTYADIEYKLDDGSSENGVGLTAGGDLIWLNRFTVNPGNNLITSISVAFGPFTIVPNGTAITLAIWADNDPPNSAPTHATLLNTAKGVVANSGADVFNTYTIPATLITGATFLVGLEVTHLAGQFPASLDQDNPQHQSFVAGGAAGTGNLTDLGANQIPVLSLDDVGLPGNWLIRANGQPPSPVPEPASLALAACGALSLLGYRLRRRRA
jgi:hypothetical protein